MRAADEKLIINELGSYTDEWMTVGDDIPDGREKVSLGGINHGEGGPFTAPQMVLYRGDHLQSHGWSGGTAFGRNHL